MQIIETNVFIIGAGPAGAAASIYLSKAGIDHILSDKALFPRDKVCGDACSGKSIYVLRNADPDWPREIYELSQEFEPSYALSLIAPNNKRVTIPFALHEGKAPGFVVKRLFFDNWLFEKTTSSFATVFQQTQIDSIERENENWLIHLQDEGTEKMIRTQLIIGADGGKGISRKLLLAKDDTPAKAEAIGIRAYYKGIKGIDAKPAIELHFLPELLPGYFWIFPLPDGRANVGAGILSEVAREKRINLREKMLAAIQTNPALKERFKDAELEGKIVGWGLPMWAKRQAVSGNGFMLCGDAANLIDPFSGEGIGNALYSGMLAAKAGTAALENNSLDEATLKELYDDPLHKRMESELKTSLVLQRISRYPSVLNFIVNKAHKSPALLETITGMFTDIDLRKKLRQPGFYLRMLFNR